MNKPYQYFFLFLLIFSILTSSITSASDDINDYVVDNANVFSPDIKDRLIDALRQFESESNGTQIVVYTEDNIPEGITLEERSLKLAESNGIGQEASDNGVLFYLAVNDRQYRWEVGYGLEPILNSAWLGRMSREYMLPKFQQGDFQGDIIEGLYAVEPKILNNTDSLSGKDDYLSDTNTDDSVLDIIFFAIFAILGAIYSPFSIIILIIIIFIIKNIIRKKNPEKYGDEHFNNAASSIFWGGRGGFGGGSFGGGGFSGGGGSFGGGGFGGRF